MEEWTGVVTNKAHFRRCWASWHNGDSASRQIRKGNRWWIVDRVPGQTSTCIVMCDPCHEGMQEEVNEYWSGKWDAHVNA